MKSKILFTKHSGQVLHRLTHKVVESPDFKAAPTFKYSAANWWKNNDNHLLTNVILIYYIQKKNITLSK